MRKFNAVRRIKKQNCEGKKTAAELNAAIKTYVEAAVKKGQTKAEAQAKADKVKNSGCPVPTVSGPKRRKRSKK